MIKTARQLKDLIRNLSKDKSADAQILMRNYMMERFLERISLSEYRDKFILKGGMLVAAMVGLDRDGIRIRLPVGQVMEKQRALMGEYSLRTTKV